MKPPESVERRHLALGLITLTVIFGGFVLATTGWIREPFQGSTHEVTAVFATASQLTKGTPVRISGVDAGQVSDLALGRDGRSVSVRMELKDDAPELHGDATAALRWRLVLGGSYAIELDPGSPSAGPLRSGEIRATRTSPQVEIDEALHVLRSRQRAGIRTMLAELPRAFADEHGLSSALDAVADSAPALGRTLAGVRGERPNRDLRALVASTARTVRALDAPADPVRDVVEGGATTLETTAARRVDLEQAIVRAASVVPRIRRTLSDLDETLAVADPTLLDLRKTVDEVAPTAADLRPVVALADRLLASARPLVRSLRPAAAALGRVGRRGRPLLDRLEPSVRRLDERILPDLALRDPVSKRPTYQMIGPTVASFTAVASRFDGVSHYAALDGASGEPKVDTAGCRTFFSDLTPNQIVKCETLLKAIERLLNPPNRRSKR